MGRWIKIVVVSIVLAMSWNLSSAQQRYRGPRQIVKGGLMQKPDTLKRDSLPRNMLVDSAALAKMVDSLEVESLKVDSEIMDSLSRVGVPDSLRHKAAVIESLRRNMPDSLRVKFGLVGADSLQRDSLGKKVLPDSLAGVDSLASDSLKKKKFKPDMGQWSTSKLGEEHVELYIVTLIIKLESTSYEIIINY